MKALVWRTILRFLPLMVFFLAGCTLTGRTSPTLDLSDTIAKPASTEIQAFVDQTDGACGYRMLRPQDWQPSQNECRYYTYQSSADDRLELRVVNYQVMAQQMEGGTIAQYEAFKLDSSLEGWAAAVEQSWSSVGMKFSLIETLPQARIYLLENTDKLELIALTIDQNQPFGVGLSASGAYAGLEKLEKPGLKADFITMVESIAAISYNPENIDPPIE